LVESGDPYAIHAAGYDFIYFDKDYRKAHSNHLETPCVEVVEKMEGEKFAHGGVVPDFRMLLRIDGCVK
jgi:hypothetical protein